MNAMSRNTRKTRKRTDFMDGLPCKFSNSHNSRSIERKFPEPLNWFMCPRLKTFRKDDNGLPVLLLRSLGPRVNRCKYRSCIELSPGWLCASFGRVIHLPAVGFPHARERASSEAAPIRRLRGGSSRWGTAQARPAGPAPRTALSSSRDAAGVPWRTGDPRGPPEETLARRYLCRLRPRT